MNEIVTVIVAVGVALGGTGTMFSFINRKIDTNKKETDVELAKGDAKFEEILKAVARVEVNIEWLKENGGK